ncbi:MAG: DUF5667 domain-containing protein [Minisyncoccia bacterium]
MNEKDFNKGIEELKNIRLSKSEKESIFKQVVSAPIESPYVKRSPIFISIFTRHAQVFVAASLIFVVSFGGVIYASDEALPGDILYPVKTAMVEPVLDRVYSAPDDKLVWEEEKVERRIAEAEKLIEKDELDDEKLAKLEAKIERSSIAFAEAASLVASSTATSSSSKKEREKKIKENFRAKINERKIAFDDDDDEELDDSASSATMMMSVPVADQDRVLNELTGESSKRGGKSLNKDKIERLKKAATRNLNGDDDDHDDDENRDDDDDNDERDDRENSVETEVEIKIEDVRI